MKQRLGRSLAAFALVLATGSCGPDGRSGAAREPEPTLEEVRAAVERYRDVDRALEDGYVPDPLNTCETAAHMGEPAEAGVMGIHYLRADLLGIGEGETRLDVKGAHTDFLQPAVLLYEPQADGSLELLGVENLVHAEAWERAGHRRPPSFHGEPYEHVPGDPSRVIAAHWDRHVWLFRDNPDGVFAQYNPDATCAHHVREMPMMMPMGDHPGHGGGPGP